MNVMVVVVIVVVVVVLQLWLPLQMKCANIQPVNTIHAYTNTYVEETDKALANAHVQMKCLMRLKYVYWELHVPQQR